MNRSKKFCDGVDRRSFLRIGSAGVFGSSWTLNQLLHSQAAATETNSVSTKDERSLIIVFLKGGLSTIDTFDMKPNAPVEIRGEFKPISTNIPGTSVCDLLPRVSQQMDKFSLIRSFNHPISNHGHADHYVLTGYPPSPSFTASLRPNNERPSHGSIISKSLGARGSIPAYVCIPDPHPSYGPAYLGANASPLLIHSDPNDPSFSVRDIVPPLDLDANRLDRRHEVLSIVDRFHQTQEIQANSNLRSVDEFRQRAFQLMTSRDAKKAFNIDSESDKLRDRYGRNTLGQSCLMARRLVEAGVRCVTISHVDWDTHQGNFTLLRRDLLPALDAAMSSLYSDLHERGMLESTIVLVTGEFGRTPRINNIAGRDHWGPAFTVMLGGGGIAGGRIVGATDKHAAKPTDNPYGPEDLAATLHHQLGINPNAEFHTPEGRPIKIANDGRLIKELI